MLPSVPPPNESELVARVRHDPHETARQAFDIICQSYAEALWRFATRFVGTGDAARDVVQDVFVALWLARTSWRPTSTIRAYLYGAVRNRALKVLRHDDVAGRTLARTEIATGDSWYSQPPTSPVRTIEQRELVEAVTAAIQSLPERQRLAVELRWQQGMGWTEIGEIMDISEAAARKLVHSAANRLQELRVRHLSE